DRYPGLDAMYPIAQVIDLCGETNQRLPVRPVPAPLLGASREAIYDAVEQEDAARAEGLLRSAIDSGAPRATIEEWLYYVVSAQFGDFGHEFIYLVKAGELLDRAGPSHAKDIYPALLYATVLQTREDTLPYMRSYFRRFAEVEAELTKMAGAGRSNAQFDPVA